MTSKVSVSRTALSLQIYQDKNIHRSLNSAIQRNSKDTWCVLLRYDHGQEASTVEMDWNTVIFSEMKPQTAGASLSKDAVTS